MRRNTLSPLSLTAKICATATTLVVLGIAITSASMHLAHRSARGAAATQAPVTTLAAA
jgi:methyl-accepting chemotaxis protein